MVKKALLVTTVSGFIPQFEMNNVRILQEMGYEVHYASNYYMPSYGKDNSRLDGTGIVRHQIDFVRSPYSMRNRQVYRQLKTLMEDEQFQMVHCHTPMGGVMARLAAHATGTGPVIYTAHGFHFYKGAPLINWLCYYPMERWLSRYTDQQICINREDYLCARKFHASNVDYIPGVGMDLSKVCHLTTEEVKNKRLDLGIPLDKKMILSAGELIKRKNHESVIRAVGQLKDKSFVYVICGHGELQEYLGGLVHELGLENQVLFTGYRSDIFEIYQIADLYVFPSIQEGLPMALLEAMASGLPVVCSDIRGSRDLMEETFSEKETARWKICAGGGIVRVANDAQAYAETIGYMLSKPKEMKRCGERNTERAELYSKDRVESHMREIYMRLEQSYNVDGNR